MNATMQRGDKFFVPLDDSDDEQSNNAASTSPAAPLPGAFVNDVLERKTVTATPPTAPKPKNSQGFPAHRKRTTASRFKQLQQQQSRELNSPPSVSQDGTTSTKEVSSQPSSNFNLQDHSSSSATWEEDERRRIDAENRARLADMSPQQIEEERRELMESLSPAFLQRLLQRSNIDSGSAEEDLSRLSLGSSGGASARRSLNDGGGAKSSKTVSFADEVVKSSDDHEVPTPRQDQQDQERREDHQDLDAIDDEDEAHEESATDTTSQDLTSALLHDTVHFPKPQQPPDLDPNSPDFLNDLHTKYFPTLPSDPSKLDWMRDVSNPTTITTNSTNQNPSTSSTSYSPEAPSLHPKDLRFSFTGALLAPRTSASIPVTAGLHHHSLAPSSAGYTISELAHLSHSAFPPQRCIAFQTLGRVLFRLGIGEFGDAAEAGEDDMAMGAEETFGELARGIWREVGREKVVEGLVLESEGKGVDGGRHVSARAYATEAVWLWRRGGGRRWKAD